MDLGMGLTMAARCSRCGKKTWDCKCSFINEDLGRWFTRGKCLRLHRNIYAGTIYTTEGPITKEHIEEFPSLIEQVNYYRKDQDR